MLCFPVARSAASILIRGLLSLTPVLSAAASVGPAALPKLPAWFEPNQGQFSNDVRFYGRSAGYGLALDGRGVSSLYLPYENSSDVISLKLEGGEPHAPAGEDRQSAITRLYQGVGPIEHSIPHYGRVRIAGVYPGIDFLWVTSEAAFRYEFHLGPGADATAIGLRFRGIDSLWISPAGELIIRSQHGQLGFRRPLAFQSGPSGRVSVGVSYAISGGLVTLRLEPYDHNAPLVIDPLLASTYFGGSGYDSINGVAIDSAGYVYLVGETSSIDFPVTRARSASTRSAFVVRLSADMRSIGFVTILASSGNDRATSVALDTAGNIYVGGSAGASNFPTSRNALQSSLLIPPVGFVAKLEGSGQVLYSTLFGHDNTVVSAIAVDAIGGVYIAGYVSSSSFPSTTGAPQRQLGGLNDGFVAKLDLGTPAVVYATLVGGSGFDTLSGIVVGAGGVACVAGSTTSPNVAVQNALQPTYGGNQDALVGCLNPAGTSWNFLTYWGGSNADLASAIAMDSSGNIVIAGSTSSPNFRITNTTFAPQSYDVFVTKLRPDGSSPIFSTVFGGSGSDAATAVAVDALGYIWVGGYTGSTDLPLRLPLQNTFAGNVDGFVAAFSIDDATLLFSTYLGGSGDDRVQAIAMKQAGIAVIAGMTSSSSFPVTPSAWQTGSVASYDGFISAVSNPSRVAMPGTFSAGNWQLDMNANRSWDGPAIDRAMVLGQAGDIPVAGDWNGDGRTKAGIFRNGLWLLDYNGNGRWDGPPDDRFFFLGQTGDIPVVGDWNGDGRAKVGIFRNGLWVLDYDGNGQWDGPPVDRFFFLGQAGDVPMVGDWNGDGRAKAGIFRVGLWVLDYNGNGVWDGTPADRFFFLGQTGDTPVIGDWNGDGRAKAGIFRTGQWVLDYNGNGVWDGPLIDRFFFLGQSGSIPIVGDWNGDGHSKAGAYSGGAWLFDLSGSGNAVASVFGGASAVPVSGHWQ